MARCPYILAEAPVLVVGVLLASALLLDGLQAVVCPILHLLHSSALILHDKAEHLNLKSHRFELSACKILRLPLAISKSRKSLKGLVCRDAQDAGMLRVQGCSGRRDAQEAPCTGPRPCHPR